MVLCEVSWVWYSLSIQKPFVSLTIQHTMYSGYDNERNWFCQTKQYTCTFVKYFTTNFVRKQVLQIVWWGKKIFSPSQNESADTSWMYEFCKDFLHLNPHFPPHFIFFVWILQQQ